MSSDAAGISDGVDAELNAQHPPDPDAKGPVDLYVQVHETKGGKWTHRVVDRWGNTQSPVRRDYFDKPREASKAATATPKDLDGNVEFEAYPGESGGPSLPVEEGDPE